MSLSYRGPSGTIEYRWIAYALLRDNVVHHLAGAAGGGQFPHLHRVTEALGGETIEIDAEGLRAEIELAVPLLERPISDLAVSGRTRALLSYTAPVPGADKDTELATACGFAPKSILPKAKTLDDAFGYLVRGLLQITEGSLEGHKVEVVDL